MAGWTIAKSLLRPPPPSIESRPFLTKRRASYWKRLRQIACASQHILSASFHALVTYHAAFSSSKVSCVLVQRL